MKEYKANDTIHLAFESSGKLRGDYHDFGQVRIRRYNGEIDEVDIPPDGRVWLCPGDVPLSVRKTEYVAVPGAMVTVGSEPYNPSSEQE